MPAKQYGSDTWSTPLDTLEQAKYKATEVANFRQQSVAVWGSGKNVMNISQYWIKPLIDGKPDVPNGQFMTVSVWIAHPDPLKAPVTRWPVVEQNGYTESSMRDVRVESWRALSRQIAGSNNDGTLQPYNVRTGSKPVKLYGRRMTLHTYIVRQNPRFVAQNATFKPHPPR